MSFFYLFVFPILSLFQETNYRVFIPAVVSAEPRFGIAMASPGFRGDLETIGAQWSYTWTDKSDPPLLKFGNISPNIPPDYDGYILFLNEPNVSIQANLSPDEAARRFEIARAYYPDAEILCCGVSVFAVDWIREFYETGARPDGWHVHAYTESWITPAVAQRMLLAQYKITGGYYWVTEYGSPAGSLSDFSAMTEFFIGTDWISRIAAYTNREPIGEWWSIGQGVNLVNADGTLTPIGEYYAKRIQDETRATDLFQ